LATWRSSTLFLDFHPQLAASIATQSVELLETGIELLQQGLFAGTPVFEVTVLARLIEVLAGVPQKTVWRR
jgi:hypothetical protein